MQRRLARRRVDYDYEHEHEEKQSFVIRASAFFRLLRRSPAEAGHPSFVLRNFYSSVFCPLPLSSVLCPLTSVVV
jgi:hypothetical protein